MVKPDAMISAASMINRDWGSYGYSIAAVVPIGWSGAVALEVCASDGGRFWVGSTQYGNTTHGDDRATVEAALVALVTEEARP